MSGIRGARDGRVALRCGSPGSWWWAVRARAQGSGAHRDGQHGGERGHCFGDPGPRLWKPQVTAPGTAGQAGRVVATIKHFPGLGRIIGNTDVTAVGITDSPVSYTHLTLPTSDLV